MAKTLKKKKEVAQAAKLAKKTPPVAKKATAKPSTKKTVPTKKTKSPSPKTGSPAPKTSVKTAVVKKNVKTAAASPKKEKLKEKNIVLKKKNTPKDTKNKGKLKPEAVSAKKKKSKKNEDDDDEIIDLEPIGKMVKAEKVLDADEDELIVEDEEEIVEDVKPKKKSKKIKQPKTKTYTAINFPQNITYQEKPLIEQSVSGRKSFKTEYTIKSSPAILFDFVTTPSGLVLWFADRVDINGDNITFEWNGAPDNAIILEWIEEDRVKYRWDWMEEDEFFQFRIYKNEVTRDTILEIIDFADEKDIPDQKLLWESQIKRLIKSIGG